MRMWCCGSILVFTFCVATVAQAQTATGPSGLWCKDTGTWCAESRLDNRALAGVRFIAEPRLGFIFAKADDLNRVTSGDFGNLVLIGAETNLWRQLVSLQGILVTPGQVSFDPLSPLVKDKRLVNPDGEIGVDVGFAVGVSFLDGVVAFGGGRLKFDKRQITNPLDSEAHATFYYFNIQAISAVRSAIKATKP